MKKTTRLLLLGVTSAMLLTGCGGNGDVVTIDNKQYLKNGDTYTQIETATKTFQPGEHIIYYNYEVESFSINESGWGNADMQIPEVPEGYKFVDTSVLDLRGYGYTSNIVYIFVNEVPVEASMTYNSVTKEIGYFEPGVPVKELTLGQ